MRTDPSVSLKRRSQIPLEAVVFRNSALQKTEKEERQKSARKRAALQQSGQLPTKSQRGFSDGSSRYSLTRTRKRLDPVMERKDSPTRIAGEIAGADKTVPEMAKDTATIPATVGPAEIADLGGGQAVLAANTRIPKVGTAPDVEDANLKQKVEGLNPHLNFLAPIPMGIGAFLSLALARGPLSSFIKPQRPDTQKFI